MVDKTKIHEEEHEAAMCRMLGTDELPKEALEAYWRHKTLVDKVGAPVMDVHHLAFIIQLMGPVKAKPKSKAAPVQSEAVEGGPTVSGVDPRDLDVNTQVWDQHGMPCIVVKRPAPNHKTVLLMAEGSTEPLKANISDLFLTNPNPETADV